MELDKRNYIPFVAQQPQISNCYSANCPCINFNIDLSTSLRLRFPSNYIFYLCWNINIIYNRQCIHQIPLLKIMSYEFTTLLLYIKDNYTILTKCNSYIISQMKIHFQNSTVIEIFAFIDNKLFIY